MNDPDVHPVIPAVTGVYELFPMTPDDIFNPKVDYPEILEARRVIARLLLDAGYGPTAAGRILRRHHATVLSNAAPPETREERAVRLLALDTLAKQEFSAGRIKEPILRSLPPSLSPPPRGRDALEQEADERRRAYLADKKHKARMRARAVRLTEHLYNPSDQRPCLICGQPMLRKEAAFGFACLPSDAQPAPKRKYKWRHAACAAAYEKRWSRDKEALRLCALRHAYRKGVIPRADLLSVKEKRCTICDRSLPLSAFGMYVSPWTRVDGTVTTKRYYRSLCRSCDNAQHRAARVRCLPGSPAPRR
jgi:hypothetical protein